MQVRVRLFASLRDVASEAAAELELPPGATAEDAWRALVARHPALETRRASLAAAVNRSYADWSAVLRGGRRARLHPPRLGRLNRLLRRQPIADPAHR